MNSDDDDEAYSPRFTLSHRQITALREPPAPPDTNLVITAALEQMSKTFAEAIKARDATPITLNIQMPKGKTRKTVTTRRDAQGHFVADVVEEADNG